MKGRLRLTRRRLLSRASGLAVLAAAVPLVACDGPPDQEPWSEGSWFDDGTGWLP